MKNNFPLGAEGSSIVILTVNASADVDLVSVIAAAFSECSVDRAALLIRAEGADDLLALASALGPAMLQPPMTRPAAVSIVVSDELLNDARELSFSLALSGVVLGDFTDPVAATHHALRERALVLAEASSASKVRKVKSRRA